MTYPSYLRENARELRTKRRLSLDEIAERLALPKTTVWYWISDLPLQRPRRANPGQRLGNEAMSAAFAAKRAVAYADGQATFASMCAEPGFRDFVCLYLAEGYKRNRNVVSLCNSDPAVIVLATRWIRGTSSNAVTFRLQYHADQDPDELRRFWGELVRVDRAAVSLQRKSNSNRLSKRSWRSPYGVLTVGANDTLLRARIEAWMDCLRESWA